MSDLKYDINSVDRKEGKSLPVLMKSIFKGKYPREESEFRKFFNDIALWYSKTLKHIDKLEKENTKKSMMLELEQEKHIKVQKLTQIGNWEWNLNEDIISISQGFANIFGIQTDIDHLSFIDIFKFVHPSDKSYVKKTFEKVIFNDSNFDFFYRILTAQNVLKVIHTRGHVLKGRLKGPTMVIGTNQDVTGRMLQEKRFKDLMEAAPDAIFSLDKDGNLIDWNRKAEEMFGWKLEEIIKSNLFYEILKDEQLIVYNEESDELEINRENLNRQIELIVTNKYGKSIPVEITLSELEREDKHIFIGFVRDSTERNKAQNELKEKEELYRTVVQSLSEGLLITDLNDRIVYANSSIYSLTGFTNEEIIGKPANILFLKPKDYFAEERLTRRLSGIKESYELQLKRKNKTSFWANINAAPYLDGNDKIIGTVGVFTDITFMRRKNEIESLVMAATKSQNSVIITDNKGKIEWVNEGFSLLTGYQQNDVINNFVQDLNYNNKCTIIEYLEIINKEKQPLTYELQNFTKNGRAFWVISTLSPVLDETGSVKNIISIDSDITVRKKMEEELKQAKLIAEQALLKANRVMEDLVKAKIQVEETAKAKEKFLANMSHEIRTPMNGIIGLTNVLLKTSLNIDQKEYLSAIRTSGDTLLVVINDILDISKIEAGKMALESIPFNLQNLVNNIIELIKPKAQEKAISLKSKFIDSSAKRLIGDPARLNQILMNLLSNAIKFTNIGNVELQVDYTEQDENRALIIFKIIDTGRGIPEDKLEEIFLDYSQVSAEVARKYGGTGLGLAITKKLIELHGGKITVQSKWKKGTTFTVELEYQLENMISPEDNSVEMLDDTLLKGIKILLVEDNPINQMLARKVLGDWGCIVDTADNGLKAINILKQNGCNVYDLIFMDIKMPELDGYETTKIIRTQFPEPFNKIPIIAQTAHAALWDGDKCLQLGMNDYVSKPYQTEELLGKLIKVLNI